MTPSTPYALGQDAEQMVYTWLTQQDYHLVARNFRCRRGEIDLIMCTKQTLVFLEIRLRRSKGYATALESVTPQKQQRIIHCAQYFLLCHPQWYDYNMRFDVVALDTLTNNPLWIQAAFDACVF